MRRIERTSQFKRDYKRVAKGPHRETLSSDFIEVLTALADDQPLLANDQPLADKFRDHALFDELQGAKIIISTVI